jgi:preprotein translocase subunit SecA
VEYQLESYEMFEQMVNQIKHDVTRLMYHVQVSQPPQAQRVARPAAPVAPAATRASARRSSEQRVGRNDPCPCGSGKKYKRCCGR